MTQPFPSPQKPDANVVDRSQRLFFIGFLSLVRRISRRERFSVAAPVGFRPTIFDLGPLTLRSQSDDQRAGFDTVQFNVYV